MRRSLSEVLGQELAASLASAKTADGPTQADLDALFGATLPKADDSVEEARTASSSPHAVTGALHGGRSAPPDDPITKLKHAKYGYAALGGIVPTDSSTSMASASPDLGPESGGLLSGLTFARQPQIHPQRTFSPGQRYDPSVRGKKGLSQNSRNIECGLKTYGSIILYTWTQEFGVDFYKMPDNCKLATS